MSEKRIFAEYDISNDSYNFWLLDWNMTKPISRLDLGEPLFTLSHDASYAMMSHFLDIGMRPLRDGQIVEAKHRSALTLARAWAVEQAARSGDKDVNGTANSILRTVLEGR